jgi:hypothetical protein
MSGGLGDVGGVENGGLGPTLDLMGGCGDRVRWESGQVGQLGDG